MVLHFRNQKTTARDLRELLENKKIRLTGLDAIQNVRSAVLGKSIATCCSEMLLVAKRLTCKLAEAHPDPGPPF